MTGQHSARDAYAAAVATFDEAVRAVGDRQWSAPTPCADWNVRALVNHVTGEDRWMPPLLAGRTIADVGDTLDGDLLGADPVASWAAARTEAAAAVAATPDEQSVALSFGMTPLPDYLWQLAADHVVHAWDLATAVGVDPGIHPDLAETLVGWFTAYEDAYRQAGVIGPRQPVPADASPLHRLLGAFGRMP